MLALDPSLEALLRIRAEAQGLSINDYVEGLLNADLFAEQELTSLASEGLNSGGAVPPDPGFWEQKHRRLDERLKKSF